MDSLRSGAVRGGVAKLPQHRTQLVVDAGHANVKANTTQSLALTIGTVAGNKIIIFAPAAQLMSPSKAELNGKRLIAFEVRFVPSPAGSGNDEWRIVTQ